MTFSCKDDLCKTYIYFGVGSRDLFIDKAHTALGIFPVFFPCMLPTPLCGIFLIYKGKKTIQVFHKNVSGGGSEALLILLIQNGWRFMAKHVYVILEKLVNILPPIVTRMVW